MNAGLFALAGVAGGGFATYWTQRGHDQRLERQAREASERADRQATQRAARLVLTDLFTIISHLKTSYDTKSWLLRMRLPNQAWLDEQSQLSSSLGDQQWRDVAAAFMSVALWNDLMETWLVSDPVMRLKSRVKLSEDEDQGLSSLRETLLQACAQAADSVRPLALPTIPEDDGLAQVLRDTRDFRTPESV
jgi:hypothetical protein